MTELEIYKFVTENNLEYNAVVPSSFSNLLDELWLFVPNYLLDDFDKILGHNITDDDFVTAVFKGDYCCFDMLPILEYFGINYENVFNKGKWVEKI